MPVAGQGGAHRTLKKVGNSDNSISEAKLPPNRRTSSRKADSQPTIITVLSGAWRTIRQIHSKEGERMEIPSYIKALLIPNGKRPAGRKAWSIDLETVWIPFFTATNVTGDTRIPSEAIGAPLRLAYDTDGSVKFSKSGRPITKVAKDLADNVRMVRENFTGGLCAFANGVITDNPEGYKAQVEMAREAGEPILAKDRASLQKAMLEAMEKSIAEAEPKAEPKATAEKPKRRRSKAVAEAEAVAEAKSIAEAEPKEAVGVTS